MVYLCGRKLKIRFHGRRNRKPISVFTEQGIAMLSGLLRSKIAIQMNINIMRASVLMRQALSELHAEKTERDEEISRRKIGFRIEKGETEIKK